MSTINNEEVYEDFINQLTNDELSDDTSDTNESCNESSNESSNSNESGDDRYKFNVEFKINNSNIKKQIKMFDDRITKIEEILESNNHINTFNRFVNIVFKTTIFALIFNLIYNFV